jgi:hypothetical protein
MISSPGRACKRVAAVDGQETRPGHPGRDQDGAEDEEGPEPEPGGHYEPATEAPARRRLRAAFDQLATAI